MAVALLMLDVQRNMLEAPEPVPDAAPVSTAIARVLERGRDAGWTIVHVRNNGSADDPDAPGTSGWELIHPIRDGEHVIDKYNPDAFLDTELSSIVDPSATIVLVGMQSDFCVRETALTALQRGHSVRLVSDAHATYDDELPAPDEARRVERELFGAGAQMFLSTALP